MKTITLEDHEALVLFEFLAREIQDRREERLVGVIEHPAEFWALNGVFCLMEKVMVEPFAAAYQEKVAAARERVMQECDPEGTYPLGRRDA